MNKKKSRGHRIGTDKARAMYLFLILLLLMLTSTGCAQIDAKKQEPVSATGLVMGTVFTAKVWETENRDTKDVKDAKDTKDVTDAKDSKDVNAAKDPKDATDEKDGMASATAHEQIMELGEQLENQISWRVEGSEISNINASAGNGEGIVLSAKMNRLLTECFTFGQACEGAFDITVAPITRLWDIDKWAGMEGYEPPSEEDIQAALKNVGQEKITIEEGIIHIPAGMSLDLGAVGKGIFLDECAALLETEQAEAAIITAGGSVLSWRSKPDGLRWIIGVVDPENTDLVKLYLQLSGTCYVSTSGDYERFVEANGKRYHHIMNPKTGYPAESDLRSVTIIISEQDMAACGLMTDLLSTACFVLGKEKGEALVKEYGAEAIFIDKEGNVSYTEGAKKLIKP